jgi:hypothetical protein
MALNQWSRRALVLVASVIAVAGFLIGSSSSQEVRRVAGEGEVGRYHMVAGNGADPALKVFDTKTGRYWLRELTTAGEKWTEHPGPLNSSK